MSLQGGVALAYDRPRTFRQRERGQAWRKAGKGKLEVLTWPRCLTEKRGPGIRNTGYATNGQRRTYRTAYIVQEPVVLRAAEVDIELMFVHADRLQSYVQDVLCHHARQKAKHRAAHGRPAYRSREGSPAARSGECWQGNCPHESESMQRTRRR